jgi:cytochrome c oxidase subunit III
MTPERGKDGSRLHSHFDTIERQVHAVRLGMWIFLGSEVLLFGGLFALYAAYRREYNAEFHLGLAHNHVLIGTANTVVLIVSSFTVAWAIHALRGGRTRASLLSLAATMALGATFLALKAVEYTSHFSEGIVPGPGYSFAELPGHGARLFFTLYFFATGLHALHMLGGLALMAVLSLRIRRGRTTPEYHAELEMGGLYWHLVDCIWIFLWPLFYLTG